MLMTRLALSAIPDLAGRFAQMLGFHREHHDIVRPHASLGLSKLVTPILVHELATRPRR